MSNKKPPIPQCPIVPVEEEIEEDLKTIDETEAPLLTGKILSIIYISKYQNLSTVNYVEILS